MQVFDPKILLVVVALVGAAWWVRVLRRPKRYAYGWTAEFIASPEFLRTKEWADVRYEALRENDGRCECCGRSKHDGIRLNVDHIRSRRRYPQHALDLRWLQVTCDLCNWGKGNRHSDDWRAPNHPHRKGRGR